MVDILPHTSHETYVQLSYCQVRSQYLSDVSYDVKLNMARGDWFSGCATLTFKLLAMPSPEHATQIFIDCCATKIDKLSINGDLQPDSASLLKENCIPLATGCLLPQQLNTVKVYFLCKYSTTGVGLDTYIEQESGEQYLKTRFEADYCRYVFPCFDQPDLKAKWRLSVTTEADWTVINNEAEVEGTPDSSRVDEAEAECSEAASLFESEVDTEPLDSKIVLLEETNLLPTHVYTIVAGPYAYHERRIEG